ncbi:VOC family protein [Fodinicurvata sp. EGI_FJ10296]|uniref:VOC family protein n=1 Tax=Fodinicurvata sp. EGI_FJ10296 TaxID=3231908 RepID=UPI0034538BFA
MSSMHGRFVWRELMTNNMAAAEKFYCDLIGWKAKDASMPDGDYTLFTAGDTEIAGMMPLTTEARDHGARPGWIGYIAVDDVDACADRIAGTGGQVHVKPRDIPSVGRFAVVADPHGAVFSLLKPVSETDQGAPDAMLPGYPGWNELCADDLNQAFDYYSNLFGWTKADAVDMGEMGPYQLFAASDDAGGQSLGGMMKRPEAVPAAFWQYYFIVDGIEAAAERAKSGGGTVIAGPHEVPGGSWIIHVLDPEGSVVGLVGPLKK